MRFNYSKLKGKIIEVFGSQCEFAKALGRTESYISRVLRNKVALSKTEMYAWCYLLKIPVEEISSYFFATEFANADF